MRQRTSDWLRGQIDVVRKSARETADTVQFHNKDAAEVLRQIEYICNRASNMIEEAAKAGGRE